MPTPPRELSHEEELQAITDALAAIATAAARQLDAGRFVADLRLLADAADQAGKGPSAGLIDEISRGVERRLLTRKTH